MMVKIFPWKLYSGFVTKTCKLTTLDIYQIKEENKKIKTRITAVGFFLDILVVQLWMVREDIFLDILYFFHLKLPARYLPSMSLRHHLLYENLL